jgi:hypothetical protein
MSEPIRLYDHMGTLYVTHSPSVAASALREGLLFMEPPAHTVPEPTPDDTQDVPVVPTGRARRKSSGNGGVL